MNWQTIFSEQKQIIAAVVAGLFAILAAYIRRDHKEEKAHVKVPVMGLLLWPLFYLLVGGSLLFVEFYYLNVIPGGDLSLHNPGAILCLAGCVFVVAGVVWLPINLLRLMFWPRPKEPAEALHQPLASEEGMATTG
jgi:hypothetical protein